MENEMIIKEKLICIKEKELFVQWSPHSSKRYKKYPIILRNKVKGYIVKTEDAPTASKTLQVTVICPLCFESRVIFLKLN